MWLTSSRAGGAVDDTPMAPRARPTALSSKSRCSPYMVRTGCPCDNQTANITRVRHANPNQLSEIIDHEQANHMLATLMVDARHTYGGRPCNTLYTALPSPHARHTYGGKPCLQRSQSYPRLSASPHLSTRSSSPILSTAKKTHTQLKSAKLGGHNFGRVQG